MLSDLLAVSILEDNYTSDILLDQTNYQSFQ